MAGREQRGTAYLLHLVPAYRHARHYLGWTTDLLARVAEHQTGRGARLVEVAANAGSTFELARTWPGVTRSEERRLKNLGGAARVCPLCSPGTKRGEGRRKAERVHVNLLGGNFQCPSSKPLPPPF